MSLSYQQIADAMVDCQRDYDMSIDETDWPRCFAWCCTMYWMLEYNVDYLTACQIINTFFGGYN